MDISNFCGQSGLNITQYALSDQAVAYQKDGKQTAFLSVAACARISVLSEQLTPLVSPLETEALIGRLFLACMGLGCLSIANLSLAPRGISKIKNERLHHFIDSLLKASTAGSYKILQNSNRLIDGACFVSYVALISLGFPVNGGLGLAGLCLMALKRGQKIPPLVERYLTIITPFLSLGSVFFLSTSSLFKWVKILELACTLLSSSQFKLFLNSLSGRQDSLSLPGKYEPKGLELTKELIEGGNFDEKRFKINETYIYAPEVSQILSKEDDSALDQIEISTLIADIRSLIVQRKIVLSKREKEGFDKITKGAIKGNGDDSMPTDVEKFKKIMKALLYSIKNDQINFELRVKELAEVGHSCVTGWTKDVVALLHPKTSNLRWAVHHSFSILRGEKIKEALRKLGPLNALGGNNNVHMTQIFQLAIWHRFRTYEGEMHRQLNPYSFFGNYIVKKLLPNSSQPVGKIDFIYGALEVDIIAWFYWRKAFYEMKSCMENHFSDPAEIERLVDFISDRIDPKYLENVINEADETGKPNNKETAKPKFTLDVTREISLSALQGWFSDIYNKFDGLNLMEDLRYVKIDFAGQPSLTRKGVYLLLWDLGILQYSPLEGSSAFNSRM